MSLSISDHLTIYGVQIHRYGQNMFFKQIVASNGRGSQYWLFWPGNYARNTFIDRFAKYSTGNVILGWRLFIYFIFGGSVLVHWWFSCSLNWYMELCWWKIIASFERNCVRYFTITIEQAGRRKTKNKCVCGMITFLFSKTWKTTSANCNDTNEKRGS